MSKIWIIGLAFVLFIASCSDTPTPNVTLTPAIQTDRVEVFCFHGTRQCETCKNMKANTRETLETYFAEQLKDSTIVFRIVDVDDEKNAALAEKFEATGTALMINKIHNGRDSIMDWSDFAFEKANSFDEYLPELKAKIDEVLP